MGSAVDSGAAHRRAWWTLRAAALVNGPAELLDFLIPLWAGPVLGASGIQVGLLVGTELAVSVAARPVAGVLADTGERRLVAAAGAVLSALSCLGYAAATSMGMALVAAAVGGVGGALFWVAVRAIVGEQLRVDAGVYPRLMSWQETGAWVAFLAGLSLLPVLGHRAVFLACAAACLLAALALTVAAPAQLPRTRAHAGQPGQLGRRLRPMLVAVAATMTAESAIGMLLLLQLQRGFGLDTVQIALVFLPGALAMSMLPGPVHRLVLRHGRRRVIRTAFLASAVFAAALSLAPPPGVIAVLWVLSGAAWAAVLPIQQAVIAEASGGRLGRGFGLYESASLIGGAAGAVTAGILYDTTTWTAACLVFAAVLLTGAVLLPVAVRRLRVSDRPSHHTPGSPPGDGPLATGPTPAPDTDPTPGPAAPPPPSGQRTGTSPKTPRRRLVELGQHATLVTVTHLVLAAAGLSWLADLVSTHDLGALVLSGGRNDLEGVPAFLYGAGRLWVIILVLDVVWTTWTVLRTLTDRRSPPEPGR
jgi:DHA1 family multidrug resistance protein-like MFS transporter